MSSITRNYVTANKKGSDLMAVYKDGDKWRVVFRYTDWMGERRQTQKRGFVTKREAQM